MGVRVIPSFRPGALTFDLRRVLPPAPLRVGHGRVGYGPPTADPPTKLRQRAGHDTRVSRFHRRRVCRSGGGRLAMTPSMHEAASQHIRGPVFPDPKLVLPSLLRAV